MPKQSAQKKTFDIVPKHPNRLNLSYSSRYSFPLSFFVKITVGALVFIFFIGSVQAPQVAYSTLAAENEEGENNKTTQEERLELENELTELEQQIVEHQNTIDEYKRQGKTLNNEIYTLNAQISQINLKIKAIGLNLEKLNVDITETQAQINQTEYKIDNHKIALGNGVRNLYEADNVGLIEILLANNKLSDFFGNINDIALVQNNLRIDLTDIVKLRQELLEQKQELTLEKEDVENLKTYRESQKQTAAATKGKKADILKITKGKESEYQKLLAETKKTAAEIRSRIFRFLGGGELTFEKAYEFARLAESATGVRAAIILAILDRESLFGKNVGRCSYKTAMSPGIPPKHGRRDDISIFLDLLSRLDLDPNSEFVKVSCPIAQHGSYGGAMGPAQFIPSTWKIYEEKIATVTGNNPPSPWNNADAFVATAVYIKDLINSSGCQSYGEKNKHIIPKQTLVERCAAAKYYSGKRWYYYRFWYGEPVVTKANEFEEDIRILNS